MCVEIMEKNASLLKISFWKLICSARVFSRHIKNHECALPLEIPNASGIINFTVVSTDSQNGSTFFSGLQLCSGHGLMP